MIDEVVGAVIEAAVESSFSVAQTALEALGGLTEASADLVSSNTSVLVNTTIDAVANSVVAERLDAKNQKRDAEPSGPEIGQGAIRADPGCSE